MIRYLLAASALVGLCAAEVHADVGGWPTADASRAALAPPQVHAAPSPRWLARDGSLGGSVLTVLLRTYHYTLSATDIEVCAFTPSCSGFAEQAIAHFGLLGGMLRGADRLIRDHPGVPGLGYRPAADGRHFVDAPRDYLVDQPCVDCGRQP